VKRWIKWIAGIGVILMLLWLGWQGAGVRSRSGVERYKDQLKAAGEELDWRKIVGPPLRSESNSVSRIRDVFAQLAVAPRDLVSMNTPDGMHMVGPARAMVISQQEDIWNSEGTNAWNDLAAALAHRRPALEILRSLPEDCGVDFGLAYHRGFQLTLDHLGPMKRCGQVLAADVLLRLHERDDAEAIRDLRSALILLNALGEEPLIISQLVRCAMTAVASSGTWEFLQSTNVTDAQLAELQWHWARLRFVEPLEKAFLMERALGPVTLTHLRAVSSPHAALYGGSSPSTGTTGLTAHLKEIGASARRRAAETIWRTSWSFEDEHRMLEICDVLVQTSRRIRTNQAFLPALQWRDSEFTARELDVPPDNWLRTALDDEFADMLASPTALSKTMNRILAAEVNRDIVVTAIALRRYQLRHGYWPETLAALVPEFLEAIPRDAVDGSPLHYKKDPGGTFQLYSIGRDGKDDGGFSYTPAGPGRFYWLGGADWVWPLPASPAEVEAYRISHPPKP
jgi:hypothetical protein